MALDNLIEKKLISCSPSTPVMEAAKLMESEDVGAVLITENDEPVGILTDRDIVIRCFVKGKFEDVTVSEIMTANPETVKLSDGIFDVIQVMKRSEVRRVPVVDNKGKACGLVSFGDIFQLLGQEISMLCENLTPDKPKIDKAAA